MIDDAERAELEGYRQSARRIKDFMGSIGGFSALPWLAIEKMPLEHAVRHFILAAIDKAPYGGEFTAYDKDWNLVKSEN